MPIIEHLPGGRWRLIIPSEGVSPATRYEQHIIFGGYLAQTEYHGEERVWKIETNDLKHETKDSSL